MYQRMFFAYSLILFIAFVRTAANDIAITDIKQMAPWIVAKMQQCKHATLPQGDAYRLVLADHNADDFALLGQIVNICGRDRLLIFSGTPRQEWLFQDRLIRSIDKKKEGVAFIARPEMLSDQKLYEKILADLCGGWTKSDLTRCRPYVKKSEKDYYLFLKQFPTHSSPGFVKKSFGPAVLFSLLAQKLGIDCTHYYMDNIWGGRKGCLCVCGDHYLWIKKEAIKDIAAKLCMNFENFKL